MKRSDSAGSSLGGLLVALLLAGVVSNFASARPDGLDSAAAARAARSTPRATSPAAPAWPAGRQDHELGDSPLADYGIRGIDNAYLSTGLSGVLGVLLTFAVGGGIFWLVRRRGSGDAGSGSGDPAGEG